MVVDEEVESCAGVGVSAVAVDAGMGLTVSVGWGVEDWVSLSESSSHPMLSVGDIAAPGDMGISCVSCMWRVP